MPANSTTRHAVARTTGSTTLANKAEQGWTLLCLNHGTENPQPSRGAVWKAAAHPEAWCPKCKIIAAGKADKITEGLLPVPTPATKKEAAKRTTKKVRLMPGEGYPDPWGPGGRFIDTGLRPVEPDPEPDEEDDTPA